MRISKLLTGIVPPSGPGRDRRSRRLAPVVRASLVVLIPTALLAGLQLRYDTEYPAIGYSTGTPTDDASRLRQRIESGEARLQYDGESGYLASVLSELEIDVASQVLIFSKTSNQTGRISPEKPRAVYFKDDAYVGWVQGGRVIEISALDPELGPVFYTLDQRTSSPPEFRRETFRCLRCHDTYSLTGGGVPRYLMGSMFPDANGQAVSHEGWHLTTDQSPIRERWGGWYVTGTHGDQRHMGNLIVTDPTDRSQFDLSRGANVTELETLIDAAPYLGKHSDIVALLILEHQVYVQNLIIGLNWEARSALYERQTVGSDDTEGATMKRIEDAAEPLVRAMLFVGEAPLAGPITGTSGFSSRFMSRGRTDAEGRSLREFDLKDRLFRYPMSYLIYSSAFDALPDPAKDYVYWRLREVLAGRDRSEAFAHISDTDRTAILEILEATKPEFAASLGD